MKMSINMEDCGRSEIVYGKATERAPTPEEEKAIRSMKAKRRNGKQPNGQTKAKEKRIHITLIEIENFKSFSGKKTTIPFNEGCTCISGPNGAGKSSIIEAIRFALLLAPFTKTEEYINAKSGTDEASVSVTFSDGTYIRRRIRQTPASADSLYYLNHKISSPEKIDKHLESMGIRPNGYMIVTHDDISRILSMNGFERRKIIDETAGITEYDTQMMNNLADAKHVQKQITDTISQLVDAAESLVERYDEGESSIRNIDSISPDIFTKIIYLAKELQQGYHSKICEYTDSTLRARYFEEHKKSRFMAVFNAVNENFQNIYHGLTGYTGQFILEESPAYATKMTMARSVNGNKICSLDMMSGGEKSVAALSFIFAVQQYLPAPFYIFDDADATLDDGNVELFAQKIRAISKTSQVIIVSHRKPVIDAADYQMAVSINPKDRSTLVTGIKRITSDGQQGETANDK